MPRMAAGLAVVILGIAGCGGSGSDSEPDQAPDASTSAAPSPSSPSPSPSWTPAQTPPGPVRFNRALHDELMAMFRRDQAGRTGGVDNEGDTARTERLEEIIAEYGWPSIDLVGEDGADAAWAIAQHSDLDPAFQAVALKLLRAAARDGQASWGNVAYLADRVAVGKGSPQTYGTQIACLQAGAKPSTPLKYPRRVDRLRARAGLGPLDDYLAEMSAMCAGEPVR